LIDFNKGFSLAPFKKVIDIFGDGSFWAISTPGHTNDHISYLVNIKDSPVLIVGDAELTKWAMENGIIVNTDYGKKGRKDVLQSAKAIREFHKLFPQVEIHFSHDTEVM
jgi:glyoxylase-like metal-dependent hydrolase (beta-lactamase superfamily II)